MPAHLDVPLLRKPVPKKVTGAVPLPLVRPAPGTVAPLAQKWRVFQKRRRNSIARRY